jgi:GTP-binding protein
MIFLCLGLGDPLPISATNGSGTGDLLDEIINKLPKKKIKKEKESANKDEKIENIQVALVGKPNVGKSSLINAILGEERMIVSSTPHTTREPQDIEVKYKDLAISFIDTAGISRKGQQAAKRTAKRNTLEKFSILKSLSAVKRASIVLLMIDISEKLSHQESRLVEEIIKRNISLIIVANKWDLIKVRDQKKYTQMIRSHLPFIPWAPIHFMSALTGAKVDKLYDYIIKAKEGRETSISANALTKFLGKLIKIHTPTKRKGTKRPHIYEFKQVDTAPPVFSVRIGAKDNISDSYLNFMSNRLREKFGFFATPIKIYVEKNKQIHGLHQEPSVSQSRKETKTKPKSRNT